MILAPSFMRVAFGEEPDTSEFQGKLTTPGNSVLTRLGFSNSDGFSPLKSGGRGSVMFSAKHGFRKSHGHLGNFQYVGKMIGLEKKIPGSLYSRALRLEVITEGLVKNTPLQGINKSIQQAICSPI